jgi:hypothetical protein
MRVVSVFCSGYSTPLGHPPVGALDPGCQAASGRISRPGGSQMGSVDFWQLAEFTSQSSGGSPPDGYLRGPRA